MLIRREKLGALVLVFLAACTATPPAETARHEEPVLDSANTRRFVDSLTTSRIERMYAFIGVRRALTPAGRRSLAEAGVNIGPRLYGGIYYAAVDRDADPQAVVEAGLAAAFSPLLAHQKVDAYVWNERWTVFETELDSINANWVLNGDGTVNVFVHAHSPDHYDEVEEGLRRRSQRFHPISDRSWWARITPEEIRSLAGMNGLRWIEPVPAPVRPANDRIREVISANNIWWQFGPGECCLTGNGIQVTVYDDGIDESHSDFYVDPGDAATSRVVIGAGWAGPGLDQDEEHATKVAGVIGGTGARSSIEGGASSQWAGVAPGVGFIDAPWLSVCGNTVTGSLCTADSAAPSQMRNSESELATWAWSHIGVQGSVVGNHSYQMEGGNYGSVTVFHDRLIRGQVDQPGGTEKIPPQLQVRAAGNGGGGGGHYRSVWSEAKNALVVGNYQPADPTTNPPTVEQVFYTTHLGPASDGRIKPDLLAPGVAVVTTTLGNGYTVSAPESGTSYSAAAVTGTVALALEQHALATGADLTKSVPLPSTLRGAAIHTARDLVFSVNSPEPRKAFPGPDYASGWGLIDASAMASVFRAGNYYEDELEATCETVEFVRPAIPYLISLETGPIAAAAFSVTLAWDDQEGTPSGTLGEDTPRLMNDLDLEIIDPDGVSYYPWRLGHDITDAVGTPIPDNTVECGRPIHPLGSAPGDTDPVFVRREVDSAVSPSTLLPAHNAPDRLNNVERIDVPALGKLGLWTIRVTAHWLESPQKFSLIGFAPEIMTMGEETIPNVFDYPPLERICSAAPQLCPDEARAQERSYGSVPGGVEGTFRASDVGDYWLISMDQVCHHIELSGGCTTPGVPQTLSLGPTDTPMDVRVVTGMGQGVGTPVTTNVRSAVDLTFSPSEDAAHFLFVKGGPSTIPQTQTLPIRPSR